MNPKKKSKELKRISRENLNGRYRLSMSVFLTVTLINLFSDLPFRFSLDILFNSLDFFFGFIIFLLK